MKYFGMMENSRLAKVMLMLDSFVKKFSFCANEQFRVFETALRGRGISPVGRMRNFAGGCFIDIVVKGGGGSYSPTPFSQSTPPFLRVLTF